MEKVLKAFLIAEGGDPPRTHSIEVLLDRCRLVNPAFPEYKIRNLFYFSVEIRYPDEIYQPEAEETRFYADLSRRIVADMRRMTER
ncbi:MAG: HEPN domain-containing protein [Spirochaetaceae bacterium]|nr:HEPN domain-containing protein [Spirochaetaceae bacterium]